MKKLVIFDCDGVLVDSEHLSIGVLARLIREEGVEIDETVAYQRFLGRSLATMIETLRGEYGLMVGDDFLERVRTALYARFREALQPIPGIAETLDAMPLPFCVASSSQLDRVRLCLSITGILDRFEPHIFSSTMVSRGKPAPDLFLYAARQMGVAPEDCIVIEDSPAGIEAANAAGMTVFAFTGGTHAALPDYRLRLVPGSPDLVFDAMPDLIGLVRKYVTAPRPDQIA